MLRSSYKSLFLVFALSTSLVSQAQLLDQFDGKTIEGWQSFTGDGDARLEFVQKDGFARMQIDATEDRHNVWWAIIKRDVSQYLDMEKLEDPAYELRVEIRLRPSHAPRRVNIMINTQRTVDFHKQLREYDVDDTGWHTISMTTQDLDAKPGDSLFVQMAATDWGLGQYHVDLDYYRAEVVKVADAEPDLGEPLVYHPEIPDLGTFEQHLTVSHDALINAEYPKVNFHDWYTTDHQGQARILTVSHNQWPILRWNLEEFSGQKAKGAGVLELTTQSVKKGGNYVAAYGEDLGVEFGKIRIFEIFGGEPDWDQRSVTFASFSQGDEAAEPFNSQMTFDTELTQEPGGKTLITLPRPVMQRLLDGQTRGLLIRPLGAIDASIYDSEDGDGNRGIKLHFTTQ